MRYLILTAAVGLLGTFGACGDSGGISGKEIAKIEVTEGPRAVVANGTVSASADLPARIQIANTGSGVLLIKDIIVESTPAGAFTLISMPVPSEATPIEVWPDALSHAFSVQYNPANVTDGSRPKATVTIRTNTTINSGGQFTFYVAPEAAVARLVVSPAILDFATVQASSTSTKTANLLNTGAASLSINRIIFAGHLGYTASIAGVTYTVTAESASNGITLPQPLEIPSGSAQKVDVTYAASGPEAASGSLFFFSNDPGAPASGAELKLYANLQGPCIKANPSRVSFGGKLVGQTSEIQLEIQSCGDIDLEISDIEMVEDGNGVFGVTESAVGTYPVIVPAGSSVYVPVTYFPSAVAQLGPDGQFVLEQGKMKIRSNAYLAELDVPVDGFGTDGSCPVANIVVREGDEVLPQTVLHLSGLGSSATAGAISSYEWSVVQPGGSVSNFSPSPYVGEVTFEANIVGEYIFRLNVRDTMGTVSCSAAEYTVVVTSDDALHVELLWDTPGDINQSDTGGDQIYFSVGSDVDLHFLHPKAYGQYFDWSYDCYWDNVSPEWGIFSPSDNPRLDRDDTDGAGPENLNVNVPEQGVRYQVGVHYWNDWGYGASNTTVRVYIYGVLRDQWEGVRLVNDDMWDSHYIDWPSGQVTRIGGSPVITPNYRGF